MAFCIYPSFFLSRDAAFYNKYKGQDILDGDCLQFQIKYTMLNTNMSIVKIQYITLAHRKKKQY